jgi:peptidoglycan/xylan/chitin deacetylase (PgdA/CDA1 family)
MAVAGSTVTLTFDNGPSVSTTGAVLDELRHRQIRAWFCVVGTQLQKAGAVELARQALDEGHMVANHSLTHSVALGDDPSRGRAHQEIRQMHDLMNAQLGGWGDRWFRPFGRGGAIGRHLLSASAIAELTALEYSVALWNSVPRDWEDPGGWVETALDDVARKDHTVVVLHDLPTGAMAQLPRFLDRLAERGVRFTDELPISCVPIARGIPQQPLDALVRGNAL